MAEMSPYTGFIPTQLMTNTSGCCYSLRVQRMPQNRIPLKSYNYRPQGKRSIGRSKKRWREQL